MKAKLFSFTVGALFALRATAVGQPVSLESAPPVVVKTAPVAGAANADPRTSEIVVQFTKPMQDGSWSWSTWGEENFPETTGKPRYLADGRTCVLPVKLQAGKFYAIWLNSDKFKNFTDAAGQPAVPYLLTFHTTGNGGGSGAGGLDAKIAQLAKAGTEIGEVIRVLGEPKQYLWGNETFQKGNLPATYIMQYPGGVHIMVGYGQVRELRSEPPGPGFAFHGRLRLGSSLDEVLQVVGQPTETVVGRKLEFQPGVLYKDIEGKKGDCYYARPEQHFRCFFTDNRVSALYLPLGEEVDSSTAKPSASMTEREVKRLVSGFPEARDLSTPEGACATWQRATAAKDGKAISQLSLVPLDPKEQEDWFAREATRDAEGLAVYLKAIADSRIVTVQVWREALANVITFLPFPEGKGRAPYSARTFGLVNGEWKNLGEDRLPDLDSAKAAFVGKKERLWEQYRQLKPQGGAAIVPQPTTGTATTAAPLSPLPSAEQLPGQLIFQGRYRHRSRGGDIDAPSQLWIKESPGGGLSVLAEVPFMSAKELVVGDQSKRFIRFQSRGKSGYELDLELKDGSIKLSRRGVRQDVDGKELTVPAGAWFDPNTRPDSYVAANLLLRGFAVGVGETKEFRVYDWDNSGEGLADYTIRVKHAGKEKVEVPAGTFEANHFVLTQVTSADTWFKKRAGHVTDYWVLDNHVIVRVLRHREPYEMLLLDYTVPEKLAAANPASIPQTGGGGGGGGEVARLRTATPATEGIREAWSAAVAAIQREETVSALASLRTLAPRIQEFRDIMKGTSLEAGAAAALETLKPLISALEKGDLESARTAMQPMLALGRKMEEQVKAITDASPAKDPFASCRIASFGGDKSEGQQSYGGSGPAIRFMPAEFLSQTGVVHHLAKHFERSHAGRIWYVNRYDPATGEMLQPMVHWPLTNGITQSLSAESALYTNGVWTFYDVHQFIAPPQASNQDVAVVRTNVLAMPEFTETPNEIAPVKSAAILKGVRLYASRYGSGYSPEEAKLRVIVRDANGTTLAANNFAYAKFGYKTGWVDLAFDQPVGIQNANEPVTIALDPEATQSKGIYFHYQKNPATSHSLAGSVASGFKELSDREWMVRACFE